MSSRRASVYIYVGVTSKMSLCWLVLCCHLLVDKVTELMKVA